MRRTLPLLVTLALGAGAFWSGLGPSVHAEDEKQVHLDYRRTYAEALLESRIRNVPVLVTRHKDD